MRLYFSLLFYPFIFLIIGLPLVIYAVKKLRKNRTQRKDGTLSNKEIYYILCGVGILFIFIAVKRIYSVIGIVLFSADFTLLGAFVFGIIFIVFSLWKLNKLKKYEFENTTDGGIVKHNSYGKMVKHKLKQRLYFIIFCIGIVMAGWALMKMVGY